jgi:hypothetical protein
MQCEHKKRDGKRCGARALTGCNRCAIHAHPGRAAELGSKGGRGRAVYRLGDLRSLRRQRPRPISAICLQNQLSKFAQAGWTQRSPMLLATSERAICAQLRCQMSKSD